MKKLSQLATILITLLFFSTVSFAKEPENLALFIKKLEFYHDSGQYNYDIDQVTRHAKAYLAKRIAMNQHAKQKKKLAIVFDIDETALSNYQHLKKLHFGGDLAILVREIERSDDPAINGTLRLYDYAHAKHVAIFFITGRKDFLKALTKKNLKAVGYTQWNGLYFMPDNDKQKSVIPYKAGIRKQITNKGYDIVISIGDQYSDLLGGYDDRQFKLPNPYYYIP